jgi:hypothetical protein
MRLRSAYAIALLPVMLSAPAHPAWAGALRWFGPLCAKLDLEAIAVIERRGEEDLPPDRQEMLAAAGLQFLAARLACLDGDVDAGAELYRGILRLEPASTSIEK